MNRGKKIYFGKSTTLTAGSERQFFGLTDFLWASLFFLSSFLTSLFTEDLKWLTEYILT